MSNKKTSKQDSPVEKPQNSEDSTPTDFRSRDFEICSFCHWYNELENQDLENAFPGKGECTFDRPTVLIHPGDVKAYSYLPSVMGNGRCHDFEAGEDMPPEYDEALASEDKEIKAGGITDE